MKKPAQLIYFFKINNAKSFKSVFKKSVIPLITSVYQMADVPANQPDAIVNVAFTQTGLKTLGITDDLKDPHFSAGQYVDSRSLGDATTKNWVPTFKGTGTHGVFIISRYARSGYTRAQKLITYPTVMCNKTSSIRWQISRRCSPTRPSLLRPRFIACLLRLVQAR
jgi:hypothetical protein